MEEKRTLNVSRNNGTYIRDLYHYYFEEGADLRTEPWPLMSNPTATLVIIAIYVFFVMYLGPRFMKNRQPYNLKKILVFYNAFQAIISLWLFYECIMSGWLWDYSFRCQPIDRSTNPRAMRIARTAWWYFATKFLDMLDTIFFVLRKRFAHITVLHVFHHAIMPFGVWYGVKFVPGGHSTFTGLANTFVHTIMYAYYLLAALGPKYKKYLWWKKQLTILQLVQFFVGTIHAGQLFFIDCDFPPLYAWWSIALGPTFFLLFFDFYSKEYGSRKKDENMNNNQKNVIKGATAITNGHHEIKSGQKLE